MGAQVFLGGRGEGWKYSILAEIFVTSKIRFVTLAKIYSTSEEIFDTSKETFVTLGEIFVTQAETWTKF